MPHQHRPSVLPLKGEDDLHVPLALTKSLSAITKKKPNHIVTDLSDATYIDSSGLAALILAMQRVEGYGGSFSDWSARNDALDFRNVAA